MEFIKHLVKWENSNKPEYIEPARRLVATAHKILHPRAESDSPKVLDPFAGGGAIPLEALRLGCKAHAIDLNPVAHLIELCTLVFPQKFGQPGSRPLPEYIKRLIAYNKSRKAKGQGDLFDSERAEPDTDRGGPIPDMEITEAEYRKNPLLADFRYWAAVVVKEAWQQLWDVYVPSTDAPRPSAFLWNRTARCPNPACGRLVPLIQSRAVVVRKREATLLEYQADGQPLAFTLRSQKEPTDEHLSGTLSRNSAKCPNCQTVIRKADLEKIGKGIGFGQQITCVVESSREGKTYRSPDDADALRYSTAVERLRKMPSPARSGDSVVPNEELPYLRSIFNVHVYGIDTWAKLFNSRQLLALVTLVASIRKAIQKVAALHDDDYATAVAAFLTLALGRQADYSSTLCAWLPQGEFLGHTFTRQALGMIWDHAEGNPFSATTGNWTGAVDWISRVIEFLSSIPMPAVQVTRGDAIRTAYESSSLHGIVTDPPYYDAVPYANLSDFFYVWFRRVLADRLPDVFRTPLTPKGPEIVQLAERNPAYKHKTREFFEQRMKDAFAEGARVLDEDGLYTVVFAHKTTAAWEALVSALIGAGLSVTASWPLHTERPGRLRSHESAALASSVFLVCRSAWRMQRMDSGMMCGKNSSEWPVKGWTSSGRKESGVRTSSSRPSARPCLFSASMGE